MMDRPSTRMFLFTDIEGSTRLWEDHPEAMAGAVAEHDDLLNEAVDRNGGRVFKGLGDGICAVFESASDGLAAALEGQRALQANQWGPIGPLRVRMALHTGPAQQRRGDYFGTTLNRIARLLVTVHGGQVVVSAATEQMLGGRLPESVSLLDLGEHRLRDLARPEHVYQVRHPDLPSEFPPLLSLDSHPNNLPVQLTSFVGRIREVREVVQILAGARLVTLTGVGGTGKTRLSLQVAAELLESCADGVWLVELAPVRDPSLVVGQTAEPFGVRDMETDSGRLLIDVLADYLADKEVLLVLDNCEHLVESSAALVESLLTRCPRLRVIATSRELLGVPGEVVYPVPPLGLEASQVAEFEEAEAVHLFADRAALVQPAFRLSLENISAVQEITRRFDGLPLAIELAASRANLLTPDQMIQHLNDKFRLITSSRRDRGRHTTLDAAMDWSYDLLSAQEQSLFRQLAGFTGGWSLEAAEAICSLPEADVLDVLGRLVDQSLVNVSEVAGTNRYRYLEPVRQYALVKLGESGEESSVRDSHAEYFIGLAEACDSGLRGHLQDDWARRIESEHDNLRSALEWSLDKKHDEAALRLAAALAWFWWVSGYWKEAQRWFRRVYEATPDADPVLRGRAVYKLAALEVQRSRPSEVYPLLKESLPILEERGTEADVAWTMAHLADAAQELEHSLELATGSLRRFSAIGDSWGEAYAKMTVGYQLLGEDEPSSNMHMRDAIDTLSALGDRWTAGWFSFNFGYSLALGGNYEEARQVIEHGFDLVAGTRDRWVAPHCKTRLAAVATMTGDHEEAKRLFGEALPVHRQIGDENCTALAQMFLGEVLVDEGEFATGAEHLGEAIEGYRELHNPYGVASSLRRIGWWAATCGEHEQAARMFGAADALRVGVGGLLSVHDRDRMAEVTQSLGVTVGSDIFDSWCASGANMSEDEAIDHALRLLDEPVTTR